MKDMMMMMMIVIIIFKIIIIQLLKSAALNFHIQGLKAVWMNYT